MDPSAAGFFTAVISKHNRGGGVRAAFSSTSLAGETIAQPWVDHAVVVVVVVVGFIQVDVLTLNGCNEYIILFRILFFCVRLRVRASVCVGY